MDASPTLLPGRVVVISGVGPGLGRTLALRCAAHGADVVLVARDRERLEEIGEQVRSSGRRALAISADITDDSAVERLVASTLAEFGRVDVLINNAFSTPAMTSLTRTDFEQIRAGFELVVLGSLRMSRSFAPALAESSGAIVDINSMVLRHSQERYGSYKVAKSALQSVSHSLATEFGPLGIRVNSVAPGYIQGPALEKYFEHQAEKYGTTVDQVYEHTAAATDLKRLPTAEEIADTVVFLASPMASAVTGQCLDVNCGQYHR